MADIIELETNLCNYKLQLQQVIYNFIIYKINHL